MRLFYDPNINNEQTTLREEESKHIVKVLRLTTGDKIGVLDGKGNLYHTIIADPHPKRCNLTIEKVERGEQESAVHIAVSPTKQMDRIEWFVEKATEIGVTEISFIRCKNSERVNLKLDRLEKKAVSAMKQSKRMFLPVINDLRSYEEFINENKAGFLAHCYENERLELSSQKIEGGPILIGPEGDFTLEELELAKENGYSFVSLGENRLRTETAALYACVVSKLNA